MSSVITQEIHVLKTIFGKNVIDSVINTIESDIKNAPNKIDKNTNISNALKMFTDLFYSDDGTKRLMSMEQFGSIYICKVFDYNSINPYVYLAYSLYDIIETFNKSDKTKVPYVRIHESDNDSKYNVMIVDYPQNYNDANCFNPEDEKALNEIGKYTICFENGPCIDLICNSHIISVSNPYVKTDPVYISNSKCATYNFNFDTDLYKEIQTCIEMDDKETSIYDLFETIDTKFYEDVLKDKHLLGINVDGSDVLFTLDEAKNLKIESGKHLVNVIIKKCIVVETEYKDESGEPINLLVETNTKTVREIFEMLTIQKLVENSIPKEKMLDKILVSSLEIENKLYSIDDLVDSNVKIEVILKDKPKVFVAAQAINNHSPLVVMVTPYTKTLRQVLDGFVYKSFLRSTCPAGKKVDFENIIAKTYDSENPIVYTLDDVVEEICFLTIPYVDDTSIYKGNTYNFISYNTDTDEQLATGVAKITNITDTETIIEVTENSVASFVGQTFKVKSISLDTEKHYELYTVETDADLNMYVTITLKEANWPTKGEGTTTSTGKELENAEIVPKTIDVNNYVTTEIENVEEA